MEGGLPGEQVGRGLLGEHVKGGFCREGTCGRGFAVGNV